VSDRLIRIRIQLIDPFRSRHLWAESYEREVGDVAALQGEIAEGIARQIHSQLTHEKTANAI